MAKKRPNIIPIIEDARKPYKYRMLCGMVDVIFSDVAQPDQARIIIINAKHIILKVPNNFDYGNFMHYIKYKYVDIRKIPDKHWMLIVIYN